MTLSMAKIGLSRKKFIRKRNGDEKTHFHKAGSQESCSFKPPLVQVLYLVNIFRKYIRKI